MNFKSSPHGHAPSPVNDLATSKDLLGFDELSNQIALYALTATPPYSIAVEGKWGSGKTSTIYQAYLKLGGKPLDKFPETSHFESKFNEFGEKLISQNLSSEYQLIDRREHSPCLWYSPWEHAETSENKILPLIEIIESLENKITKSGTSLKVRSSFLTPPIKRFRKKLSHVIKNTNNVDVMGADSTFSMLWKRILQTFKQARINFEPDHIPLLFQQAINDILIKKLPYGISKKEKETLSTRLIIFIDDLDRSNSKDIISLLESTKTILHSKNCIFIFAVDECSVLNAIDKHKNNSSNNNGYFDRINIDYLDKLFQTTFSIPRANLKSLINYTETLLKEQIKDIRLEKNSGYKEIANYIYKIHEKNPRKIKSFIADVVNTWGQINSRLNNKNHSHHPQLNLKLRKWRRSSKNRIIEIILFLYLKEYHKDAWKMLINYPDLAFNIILNAMINDVQETLNKNESISDKMFLVTYKQPADITNIDSRKLNAINLYKKVKEEFSHLGNLNVDVDVDVDVDSYKIELYQNGIIFREYFNNTFCKKSSTSITLNYNEIKHIDPQAKEIIRAGSKYFIRPPLTLYLMLNMV